MNGFFHFVSAYLQTRRWKLAWTCAVLFTDNVGRFAAIKELAARQTELRARRDDAAERLQATGKAAQVRTISSS